MFQWSDALKYLKVREMSTLEQQQDQMLQRPDESASVAPRRWPGSRSGSIGARLACSRSTVAALLTISAASLLWAWPDLGRTQSTADPVVDSTTSATGVLTTTATFAPRVGLPGTVEYAHTFELRNEAGSDLVVERTSKSCGCLSATIEREAIPPGETAAVTLKVRPNNIVNKEGTLTVWAKDGRRFVYQLRTWTYPPVMLDQASTAPISFGLLAPGSRTTTIRRLFVHSDASSVPPELRCANVDGEGPIRCTLVDRGVTPIADGRLLRRTYELTVDVSAGAVPGLRIDHFALAPVNPAHEEYAFTTDVVWNVDSPILLEPARWILRRSDISSTDPVSHTVRLSHSGGAPFRITSIETSHGWVQAAVSSPSAEGASELNITVDSAQVPAEGNHLATVKLHFLYDAESGPCATEQQFRMVVTD